VVATQDCLYNLAGPRGPSDNNNLGNKNNIVLTYSYCWIMTFTYT
jgi:hypothetical protein